MSEILLSRLSDFLGAQMGLHFPAERWRDLGRGLSAAAREFGFTDTDACIQWLLASPLTRHRIEVLASYLTVGETYFFRDKKTFDLLEGQILPELIRSRRGTNHLLRIWSAGCATGEEPYSIAILLHKLIPDLECGTSPSWPPTSTPGFFRRLREEFMRTGRSETPQVGSEKRTSQGSRETGFKSFPPSRSWFRFLT